MMRSAIRALVVISMLAVGAIASPACRCGASSGGAGAPEPTPTSNEPLRDSGMVTHAPPTGRLTARVPRAMHIQFADEDAGAAAPPNDP